ncbi:MAG: hypothetical protein AABX10_04230 [Nanoarchaeota archaeon]
MNLVNYLPHFIIFLIVLYIVLRLIRRKLFEIKTKLPYLIKIKADRKFKKLLNKFKRKNKRDPTKNELFRIIISASHITIRRANNRGHWGRQRVRKYLLEKHKVVKKYLMR